MQIKARARLKYALNFVRDHMPRGSKPVVGILVPQRRYPLDEDESCQHAELIRRAGGRPRRIAQEKGDFAGQLRKVDAILIPGGGDVDPALYGQGEKTGLCYGVDRGFDLFEKECIQHAFDTRKPLMGVCRGNQILHVAAGGGLFQDLPTQYPSNGRPVNHSGPWHEIAIAPDSTVGRLLQSTRAFVTSTHHQAVNASHLSPLMKVTAQSPEGIVEGIQKKDCEWQFGVQFHPELMLFPSNYCPPDHIDPRMQRLYDYLVQSASTWRTAHHTSRPQRP